MSFNKTKLFVKSLIIRVSLESLVFLSYLNEFSPTLYKSLSTLVLMSSLKWEWERYEKNEHGIKIHTATYLVNGNNKIATVSKYISILSFYLFIHSLCWLLQQIFSNSWEENISYSKHDIKIVKRCPYQTVNVLNFWLWNDVPLQKMLAFEVSCKKSVIRNAERSM